MSDDFMLRLFERRHKALEAELRQIQADADHWNRTHPDEEPIVIEPIAQAEIEAAKESRTHE